jgi:hypothetical protein
VKLKGVQKSLFDPHAPLAYRVATGNGTLVLCDHHLEQWRKVEPCALTGDVFDAKLCDKCPAKEEL